MLFEPEDIQEEWFEDAWALHFCSVDLIPSPMQMAHRRALDIGAQKGCLISFDPNVRLPLWEDHQQLRRIIREFMPKAHILKISDEELEFITGFNTVDQARDLLLPAVRKWLYLPGAVKVPNVIQSIIWLMCLQERLKPWILPVRETALSVPFYTSF